MSISCCRISIFIGWAQTTHAHLKKSPPFSKLPDNVFLLEVALNQVVIKTWASYMPGLTMKVFVWLWEEYNLWNKAEGDTDSNLTNDDNTYGGCLSGIRIWCWTLFWCLDDDAAEFVVITSDVRCETVIIFVDKFNLNIGPY